MTKVEVQASTKEKVKTIETLCKQLKVVVSAEEVITKQGFLKKVVYYTDTEKYDLEEEPAANQPEKQLDEKTTEESEPVTEEEFEGIK